MEFTTPVRIEPFDFRIDYTTDGLSVGSCFAANMAARMKRAKLPVTDNPFGTLFNPASIADTLEALHAGRRYTHGDLANDGDKWSCFSFHGSFSSPDPLSALTAMNRAASCGERALRESAYVIITFGTSWVFGLAENRNAENSGRIVANCHRFPADTFVRNRLTVTEIAERYGKLFDTALRGKHVIFTVSPVRHIRDGFTENTLSKAVLIEAVHEITSNHRRAVYFPAFEIMNDELRDYRFYADDMLHPSDVAIDHIWAKFRNAALTPNADAAITEMEKIAAAMEHRPSDTFTASYKAFMAGMSERVAELAARYPEIDLAAESAYFSGK